MPIDSRRKGADAERQLRNMLLVSFPQFEKHIKRNKNQDGFGGCDISGLPGFAPECKFEKNFLIAGNWAQTLASVQLGEVPVLFRKVALKGWSVYLHLSDLHPQLYGHTDRADREFLAVISYDAFVTYARQRHAALA